MDLSRSRPGAVGPCHDGTGCPSLRRSRPVRAGRPTRVAALGRDGHERRRCRECCSRRTEHRWAVGVEARDREALVERSTASCFGLVPTAATPRLLRRGHLGRRGRRLHDAGHRRRRGQHLSSLGTSTSKSSRFVTVQGGAPEIPVERAATEWEVAALGLMAQGHAADAAGIHGPSPNSWRNACSRLTPCLAAVDR